MIDFRFSMLSVHALIPYSTCFLIFRIFRNRFRETKNSSETEEHAESPRKEKSSTPYGTDGFAPPPRSTQTNTLKVSNLPKRFESLYK